MDRLIKCIVLVLALVGLSSRACAGGIDHVVAFDESGIWSRSNQLALSYGSGATIVAGAMFVDSDTRLGRTFDRSMDAMVMTAAAATALKYAVTRARPSEGGDPGDFFAGGGHHSFPSGEVAQISAIVTPFIAEYRHDHPLVWGLALLPVYNAVARVKSQAHWQSDVLAGAAIGVAFGLYAHGRETPFFFHVLPEGGGVFGYRKSF